LRRDSFLEIFGQFIFLERKEEKIDDGKGGSKRIVKETMIFPRYHQLDAVRKLIAAAKVEGTGSNYLIQHSAGSGKTNSISWLAHRLASLHTNADEKIFDCVIVITDRQVLDSQLQDAVYQIEHAQGVVKAINKDSKQLAEALVDGTKIVVTTLQKFPFVLKGLLKVAGADNVDEPDEEAKAKAQEWEDLIGSRKYALVVDEAHSSQSGETSRELKEILGAATTDMETDEESDAGGSESMLNSVMAARGQQPNLSFFAFTATPKGKTLELFGREGADGKPQAFHVYSMRQAIEEDFILDVLKRYTTYKTYYRLVKSIEEDPDIPKRKGARALAKFMVMHPHNIEQKIEVIVEHFREHVQHHLGGRAKAMVVTDSRLMAVKYRLAFDRYIEEKGYNIRAMVAFSGKVNIPTDDPDYSGPESSEYTEPKMNIDPVTGKPISESQLRERFASNDYQVLLVANKYQTGFDQPLLMAMYVDKRLDGVQAVQTLSRLNRKIRGKEDPFVLDFRNETEDIKRAFKPYFDATLLQDKADPTRLDHIKHELDAAQIYHWSEVEAFANVFYKLPDKQRAKDHADLNRWAQPAVDRFKALDDEDESKWEFREKLSAYVQLYSFLSQIMPWCDPDLERLYSFGKFLLPHLPTGRDSTPVSFGDEVELEYYRLSRVWSGAIDLNEGEEVAVKSPTDVGTGRAEEVEAPLSELIDALNDQHGTEFSEDERLFLWQICEKASKGETVIKTAEANPFEKFMLGVKESVTDSMIDAMGENDELVTKYMTDSKFQATAFPVMAKIIYDMVRSRDTGS
jgi:type I restriction enzyme R subunit